ncbi:DUF6000 family protein [Flavobacterium orientale]|uniref:Uncharacterized protein n=1 Tax=Flavobacterium orientale TaxID=1756020 RepID=A0A917DH27_9FLAO|nr:DUF6000 family protein [Flavobacterium orientale]GGD36342.1 hypothetical protein GCM10011343_27750 [Flavobacterium orientale]
MNNKEIEAIKLHIAGATIRHTPPFDDLKPFNNNFELEKDFIDRWIIPYYLNIGNTNTEWINKLTTIKHEITTDIIQTNLGDFNWRSRQTGAFFAAITNQTQFIDSIGTHLLKSEVAFAGKVYCKVFASFNLPKCVDYLNLYLDYYLTKHDLWFEQRDAMEAILYLDKLNATNHFEKHFSLWTEFIKNKPNWEVEIKTDNLEKQLKIIETVKTHM